MSTTPVPTSSTTSANLPKCNVTIDDKKLYSKEYEIANGMMIGFIIATIMLFIVTFVRYIWVTANLDAINILFFIAFLISLGSSIYFGVTKNNVKDGTPNCQ